MIPLSASLAAHQIGRARVPALKLTASATRGGVELLRWARCYTGSELDAPHAAVLTPAGTLIRLRNDAGAVRQSRVVSATPSSVFSGWVQITSLVPGGTLAIAASSAELTLVTANGTYLDVRHSTDDGASWGSATTRHTALADITSCAVAYNGNGADLCVFFTVSGSPNLYRLRRTGGTWDAAVAWSNAAAVASLTGVAATHDGSDFQLLVTGTAATTNHKRAWGTTMGDFGFPPNTWSPLVEIAASDAASTTTFAAPSLGMLASLHGFYAHREAASPAYARAMYTHPAGGGPANHPWAEPAPVETASSYGVAFATCPSASVDCWLSTPNGVWHATAVASDDLSSRVVTASFHVGPEGGRCHVQLDNAGGAATSLASVVVGGSIALSPGYHSGPGGAAEYGTSLSFSVDELVAKVKDGRATLEIHASTPWEQLARWQPSQAWQTVAGAMTRSAIAQRIAGRSGFLLSEASPPMQPSNDLLTEAAAFAMTPGEHGNAALKRLVQVVPDFIRPAADTLELVGLQRYRNVVMGLLPRAYWRLGEPPPGLASGTDQAGTRDGAYTGSPLLGAPGFLTDEPATSVLFDGATQYVAIPDAAGLHFGDTFSVVAWFKRTATALTGDRSLVYGGPGSFDIQIATDDKIRVVKAGAAQIAKSTVAVDSTSAWHMLAVTKDAASSFKLWLDGVDVTDTVVDATIADTSNLRIASASGSQYLPAFVAEVAIFARALTAAEVASLWAAPTASDYTYGATGGHPITSLQLKAELPHRNWLRVQGPGRYADAIAPAAAYAGGPQLQLIRNTDATTDAKVLASAANALRRELVQEVAGELIAPANAGQELFDLITVNEPALGQDGTRYRVIGLGLEYRRGPKGARYHTVLSLGRL